jgi:hypothetical protein
MERDAIRQAMKEGASKEEVAKLKSQVVPNRTWLRANKMNITQRSGKPYGRLTRYRLAPCSLEVLIAIHVRQTDGSIKKFVVPRAQFENKGA